MPAGTNYVPIGYENRLPLNVVSPQYESCIYRVFETRKLTNHPKCNKLRLMWWCRHFDFEISPKICSECEERQENAVPVL